MKIIVHPRSYRPEVLVEGKWGANALRFATLAEALASAQALHAKWRLCIDFRARPSDEMPNYRISAEGVLLALPMLAIPAAIAGPPEPGTIPSF